MARKWFDRRHMAVILPVAVAAVIALCHFIASSGFYLMGDDYGHCRNMAGVDSLYRLYMRTGRFFLSTNGRFFDNFCGAMLAWIPRGLLCGVCAVMIALFYISAVRAVRFRRGDMLGPLMIVAAIAFLLPWGDRTMLFAVQFNYIWPAALTLFVVGSALNRKSSRISSVCAVVLAFPAGMGHEVCGPAVVCGLIVYQIMSHGLGRLRPLQKSTLAMFTAGAVFCCLSPAPFARIARVVVPDDPYFVLIAKSDFIVLAMIVFAAVAVLRRHTCRLRRLAVTPFTVWAVAAVASMVVSPLGGVVGRSGWFAQTFALIALFIWLWHYVKFRGDTVVAAALSVLLMVYFAGFAVWQVRLNREIRDVMTAFLSDPSQPVYYDYVADCELPVWLLKRVVTVPNHDYLEHAFSERIEDAGAAGLPVIVPAAVAEADIQSFDGGRNFGNCIVMDKAPAGDIAVRGGREYFVIPFRRDSIGLWLLRPKIPMWGQRPDGGR